MKRQKTRSKVSRRKTQNPRKTLKAHKEEKVPWDLIEEILSRVPPNSLVRFRTVCKRWNNLFNDKRFIKNHKTTTFHFVLTTKSKIYSVNIVNPKIVDVHELTLDIPGLNESKDLFDCNEFLLYRINQGAAVWNPLLRQSTWIEPHLNQYYMRFSGIGYDNKGNYKIIGTCPEYRWKIYDFASKAWKDNSGTVSDEGQERNYTLNDSRVSVNGTMYWVASSGNSDDCLFILGFDFSKDQFFFFCDLPCGKMNYVGDAVVLGVYKRNRFSLLTLCYATKKIEIWVTKDKINNNCNGKDVEWMDFMQVSIPNLGDLIQTRLCPQRQPSYFIDNDKRLVLCSCDKTGRPWIYVVCENKLISRIQIDAVVDRWPKHCTYNPSLAMVPSVQRKQVERQKKKEENKFS